jgi:arsenate reductase-like glutaredoxin family protein
LIDIRVRVCLSGRAGFLEKLAELKRAGSIDDETGVEFTITHTFVDPPKRDEWDRLLRNSGSDDKARF